MQNKIILILVLTIFIFPAFPLFGRIDTKETAKKPVLSTPAILESIAGYSSKGKPIKIYSMGNGPDTILYMGVFHGTESNGNEMLQKLMEYLKTRPELIQNRKVVLIPVVNPDGMEAGKRVNSRGVDINRNFPTLNWKKSTSRKRFYSGTKKPEAETKVIMKVLDLYKPAAIISIHDPQRCVNYDGPSKKMAEWMARYNHYLVRDYIGYETPGSFGTYAGSERNIPIVTLEVSKTGWEKSWEQNKEALLVPLQLSMSDITNGAKTDSNEIPANLYTAARNGNIQSIQAFLQAGSKPDERDSFGWTALTAAVFGGHEEAVKLLLDRGANTELCDTTGWTPLMQACQDGHSNIVKLLLDKGASVAPRDMFQNTAFMEAARNGNWMIAKTLLDKGAMINERDGESRTALHYASRFGYFNTAKMLIDAGADINAADLYGRTPLIEAAYFDNSGIVSYLLAKKADFNIKDSKKRTALSEAVNQGSYQSIRMIKKAKSRFASSGSKAGLLSVKNEG